MARAVAMGIDMFLGYVQLFSDCFYSDYSARLYSNRNNNSRSLLIITEYKKIGEEQRMVTQKEQNRLLDNY